MRIKALTLTMLIAAALIVGGCSAPSSPQATNGGKESAAPANTAAKPPVEPKQAAPKPTPPAPKAKVEKPKPPKKIAWGENLLLNANFSEWKDGAPSNWQVFDLKSNKAVAAAKLDEGGIGLPLPAEGSMVYAKQKPYKTPITYKAHLRFGATVKAAAEDQLNIVLSYYAKGWKEEKVRIIVKASKDWQALSKEIVLPEGADPKSVQLFLFRKSSAAGDVSIKDAFLQTGK